MFSTELKEKAALAMWSLSGKENQKMTAEMIGMGVLIEMIMDDSQILQLIGGIHLNKKLAILFCNN